MDHALSLSHLAHFEWGWMLSVASERKTSLDSCCKTRDFLYWLPAFASIAEVPHRLAYQVAGESLSLALVSLRLNSHLTESPAIPDLGNCSLILERTPLLTLTQSQEYTIGCL